LQEAGQEVWVAPTLGKAIENLQIQRFDEVLFDSQLCPDRGYKKDAAAQQDSPAVLKSDSLYMTKQLGSRAQRC
jgi:hypothetical protein